MKDKKALSTLIILSIIAVLSGVVWVRYGNTCDSKGRDRHHSYKKGDYHGSQYKGDYKKGCGSSRDADCRMCGSFMRDACEVLPSPCDLLCKKDELGLEDDQITKIKKLKTAAKKNKIKKKAELKILVIELQEILDTESVDKTALETKLEAIGTLRTQIAKDCINIRLVSRGLVTADQLKKWETLKKNCESDAGIPSGKPACSMKKTARSQHKAE